MKDLKNSSALKIGLALSGGGVRSAAHIGVIKALEELGVQISIISGTSGGAIVGALYANGYSPNQMLEFIKNISPLTILKPAFKISGLLSATKIEKELKNYFDKTTFESLKIPLTVACTDFLRGIPHYFNTGDFIKPISASSAIPVMFAPVKIDDSFYFDGGILNNLPAEVLVGKCDKIIGVHVNPVNNRMKNIGSIRKMFERTMMMAIGCNAYKSKEYCDVFLEPEDLKYYRILEYKKISEIYEVGYKYTLSQKDLILESIS
jgi:NTE family protein